MSKNFNLLLGTLVGVSLVFPQAIAVQAQTDPFPANATFFTGTPPVWPMWMRTLTALISPTADIFLVLVCLREKLSP
ncbi:hypothetical protein NON20_14920 [Synechocystis sp. B12]|nr:hypothetical protein NON20_14920 [Synechocystis sp. B12]